MYSLRVCKYIADAKTKKMPGAEARHIILLT